jgi:hypothetical protein
MNLFIGKEVINIIHQFYRDIYKGYLPEEVTLELKDLDSKCREIERVLEKEVAEEDVVALSILLKSSEQLKEEILESKINKCYQTDSQLESLKFEISEDEHIKIQMEGELREKLRQSLEKIKMEHKLANTANLEEDPKKRQEKNLEEFQSVESEDKELKDSLATKCAQNEELVETNKRRNDFNFQLNKILKENDEEME